MSEFERWDENRFGVRCYWFSRMSVRNQHAACVTVQLLAYSSLETRDVRVLAKSFIFKAAFIVIGIYICCVRKFMYPSVWCKAVRNKWIVRAECCGEICLSTAHGCTMVWVSLKWTRGIRANQNHIAVFWLLNHAREKWQTVWFNAWEDLNTNMALCI